MKMHNQTKHNAELARQLRDMEIRNLRELEEKMIGRLQSRERIEQNNRDQKLAELQKEAERKRTLAMQKQQMIEDEKYKRDQKLLE